MQRAIMLVLSGVMVTSGGAAPAFPPLGEAMAIDRPVASSAAAIDVTALLTAARGAPPAICALAAQSLRNWGWNGWTDAPSTPLSRAVPAFADGDDEADIGRGSRHRTLTSADVQRLLEALGSDDACVRELSVRLLGHQDDDATVANGFLTRLGSSDAATREVAAFGLGLVESKAAVEPLTRALGDTAAGVRANAVWALGRIEDGRSLRAITGVFHDRSELVRAAAAVAAGQMDSVSAAPALMQVVRQDESAAVRRVAAWALGELEAREAVATLTGVLGQDRDARVREMSAWALAEIEDRSAAAALGQAARRDSSEAVRETAVWALAEIEDHGSVELLGTVAANDRSARVRGTAAWALGELQEDGGSAPAGLVGLLKDPSEDVRIKAAWALGEIGDAAALPAIRNALRVEKSSQVSKALVRALVKSGEQSESALTELLNSSDPQVREAAVRGLAGARSMDPWPWPWPRPRPFP